MERKPYTRYSREFKLEAVRQAALGEKPKAVISSSRSPVTRRERVCSVPAQAGLADTSTVAIHLSRSTRYVPVRVVPMGHSRSPVD
jgi:transposase-like protein